MQTLWCATTQPCLKHDFNFADEAIYWDQHWNNKALYYFLTIFFSPRQGAEEKPEESASGDVGEQALEAVFGPTFAWDVVWETVDRVFVQSGWSGPI